MSTTELTRRGLLRRGMALGAASAATLMLPSFARADTTGISHGSDQIGKIYELQAAFHRAKSRQDIELMVSLWTEDCTFTNAGIAHAGKDAVRAFFLGSGSWLHHRISFVPSFKDRIEVHGDQAFLYFECHDVELATGEVVTHLYNAGTLRNVAGSWLFHEMHFGSAAPMSVDAIYYP
jgi:ketosteroid isomerase-like protein